MSSHNVFGLTDRQLADFVTTPVRIVAIVVIAMVLRFLIGRLINRIVKSVRDGKVNKRLHAIGEHAPLIVDMSDIAVDRRRARASTLGTVLKSIANVVILAVAVTTILGEIGINLAPIIASAGIIGVAVGFGAQNLVKDFLSGLFLVIEDTYSVGDTVDLGPAVGTVEWIGLRSTRIRDVKGTLWSVRNGEIVRVANYSQLWQRALFDVLVVQGADVDRAREVMLRTAQEQAAEERWEGGRPRGPGGLGRQRDHRQRRDTAAGHQAPDRPRRLRPRAARADPARARRDRRAAVPGDDRRAERAGPRSAGAAAGRQEAYELRLTGTPRG